LRAGQDTFAEDSRQTRSGPHPLSPPLPKGEGEAGKGERYTIGMHFRGGISRPFLLQQARELRQRQTEAEAALWDALRARKLLGLKFRRQHQFAHSVVDFFCPEIGLVIELDGPVHDTESVRRRDANRTKNLEALGCTVLRLSNDLMLEDPPRAIARIETAAKALIDTDHQSPF
jgi:very-short-patch-repair endonuclease